MTQNEEKRGKAELENQDEADEEKERRIEEASEIRGKSVKARISSSSSFSLP